LDYGYEEGKFWLSSHFVTILSSSYLSQLFSVLLGDIKSMGCHWLRKLSFWTFFFLAIYSWGLKLSQAFTHFFMLQAFLQAFMLQLQSDLLNQSLTTNR
jgi:hypothetical protein